MIRTIAIDDEPLALQQLANYIENTPFLSCSLWANAKAQ